METKNDEVIEQETYDLIVVGGGPAGLSCAIYSSRYRVKTLVISEQFGGQIVDSYEVENYPGFEMITGLKLMDHMQDQAVKFGTKTKNEKVKDIVKQGDCFIVNSKYRSKAVLLSLGLKRRKLGAPGEDKFMGLGVSYCATCDGAFFRDKRVCVIGGNNSAVEAALLLSQYAKEIIIVYRKEKLRAEPILIERIEADEKIKVVYGRTVKEIYGEKMVKGVVLDNDEKLDVEGVFVEIGWEPDTKLADDIGVVTKDGLIKVGENMSTNIEGVYAAGDCTTASNQFNQVVTAASEGAIAARSIYNFIQ